MTTVSIPLVDNSESDVMMNLDSATESAKEDEQLHSIKVKEKQTIQKVRTRARSKSPAPPGMQVHNRFHYKCCDKDTGISVEEVKQQSLKNAQKSRKSRSRTNLNSTSSISNTELNSSSPEKESEAAPENPMRAKKISSNKSDNSPTKTDIQIDSDNINSKQQYEANSTGRRLRKVRNINSTQPSKFRFKDETRNQENMTNDSISPSKGQSRTRAGHEQQIAAYLASNPNFLEKYVLRNIDLDTLERWTIRRARNLQNQNAPNGEMVPSLSKWKFCVHADKRNLLQQMTYRLCGNQFRESASTSEILHELASCISGAVGADGFNVYIAVPTVSHVGGGRDLALKKGSNEQCEYLMKFDKDTDINTSNTNGHISNGNNDPDEEQLNSNDISDTEQNNDDQDENEIENLKNTRYHKIGEGSTMAAYVAWTGGNLRTRTSSSHSKFPEGVRGINGDHFVMLHPVVIQTDSEHGEKDDVFVGKSMDANGVRLIAVLEFIRQANNGNKGQGAFREEDEEIADSYSSWGEVALHYSDLYLKIERQKNLSGFLLDVVKSIFMEMVSMNQLIIKIMNFAQRLVDADRASLFLVDAKTNQLYARIFDIKGSDKEASENGGKDIAKEIRFAVGTGIAGYVAETGLTLNVADAYTDDRFNKAIDEQTGYVTRSILCMPICIRGQVIGVVQMVNKSHGSFTKEDEEAFEMFSTYCGLALHHAKLYEKIRRSEQKYRVALEVLSYHNASSVDEVEELVQEGLPPKDDDLQKFTFYALNMDDMLKVKKALFMFTDLFGLSRFEYETVVRFLITVKKNYRQVAYHNWTHGFHVANSIYSILKSSPGVFRPLECLSMFVGAICHDLDHRGFNNKFMIDVGSPLAAIYSTSTMEHHHFNMTVTILQQENHNIFAKLSPDEYREVLGNVKHCILATDLALFFPNKARLTNILKEEAFSWDLPDHRKLAQSMCMTGSDLCSSQKPWANQESTAKVIYDEFYEQVLIDHKIIITLLLLVEALLMTGSDLCASAKPWDLQMQTVEVIYDEFYQQGDLELESGRVPVPIMNRSFDEQQPLHQGDVEKGLGWKPIPLFDRDHAEEVASMQVGFIGGICLPCYDLLVQVLPGTSPMKSQCEANLGTWKQLSEERKKQKEQAEQERAEAEKQEKEATENSDISSGDEEDDENDDEESEDGDSNDPDENAVENNKDVEINDHKEHDMTTGEESDDEAEEDYSSNRDEGGNDTGGNSEEE